MKRTKNQPLTTVESILKKMGGVIPVEECEKRQQEAIDQRCSGIKERQAEVRERINNGRTHYLKSGKKIV